MGYTEEKKDNDIYMTPEGDHTHTIIWLHGLGDSAEGFHDTFQSEMTPVSSSTKVVLLNAPTRGVTINFGMEMPCWFDYKKLDFTTLSEGINTDHLQECKERVTEVIHEEAKLLDSGYDKILIGGFSQGGSLALYTALELNENLGGIIVFSGHQLYEKPSEEISDSKKTIPIFGYHGEIDPLLPFSKASPFFKELKDAGFKVHFESEANLAHGVSISELRKAKEFIGNITDA